MSMAKHRAQVEYRWNFIWLGIFIVIVGLLVALLPVSISITDDVPANGKAVPSIGSIATITNTPEAPGIDRAAPRLPVPTDSLPIPTPTPKTVTYTVAPGDTLSSIADHFKIEGYQPLYDWNKTVIGQNPDLIRPGLVLIVAVS